jgi:drug/metabolite transporter (DMT)-like permease
MDRNQRTGMLYAFGAVVGYSCLPVFTKNLLDANIDPISLAFWRFTLAAPLFWLFVWLRNRNAPTSKPMQRLGIGFNLRLLLLGAMLAAAALAAFFGLEVLPAGMFVVIFYTYPAMIAIFGLLMGDRLPLQGWIALGLTLVGVILTTPDFIALVAPGLGIGSAQGLDGDTGRGVLLALLNALIIAVYFILNSHTLKHYPDKGRASAAITAGTMLTMWLVALFQGNIAVPQGTGWLYLIGLATVSTVFPVFSLSNGIARLGPAKASIVSTVEPLLTSVLAMIFLSERMLPIQWLGGLVIMLSIILLQLRRPEPQVQPLKPVPRQAD